jgi:cellulose biosynthesis protein BcsQ
MKVVTFSIFKGGTAKTTSTVNTAAALAHRGKKVLVIDLDQQASATRYLDLDPDASPNLYEVFMGTQQASGNPEGKEWDRCSLLACPYGGNRGGPRARGRDEAG